MWWWFQDLNKFFLNQYFEKQNPGFKFDIKLCIFTKNYHLIEVMFYALRYTISVSFHQFELFDLLNSWTISFGKKTRILVMHLFFELKWAFLMISKTNWTRMLSYRLSKYIIYCTYVEPIVLSFLNIPIYVIYIYSHYNKYTGVRQLWIQLLSYFQFIKGADYKSVIGQINE